MQPATTPIDDTDEALLARFLAGEDQAFTQLYERWSGRALHYAVRMVGAREVAEEIVTDAFVTVVQGQAAPTGRFRSYLFTVVHRRCLDRMRRRTTRARAHHLLQPVPETPDPEGRLDRRREVAQLEAAIDRLPEEHRAAVTLFYTQGLPSAEVAAILGITDQQVRSRLSYARRALRSHLETA
jgi:RNA polymerase sigma-70 factor (ECF subfamily)